MKVVNLHGIRYLLEGDEAAAFRLIGVGKARMARMEIARMNRRIMRSKLCMDTGATVETEMCGRVKVCRIWHPLPLQSSLRAEDRETEPFFLAWDAFDKEGQFKGLVVFDPENFSPIRLFPVGRFINELPDFTKRGENDVEVIPNIWVYQCRANEINSFPRYQIDYECKSVSEREDPDDEWEPFRYIHEKTETETYQYEGAVIPRDDQSFGLWLLDTPAWPRPVEEIHRWAVTVSIEGDACENEDITFRRINRRAYQTGVDRNFPEGAVIIENDEITHAAYFATETVETGEIKYAYTYNGDQFTITEEGSTTETYENLLVIDDVTISLIKGDYSEVTFNYGENPYGGSDAVAWRLGRAARLFPIGDDYFFIGHTLLTPSSYGSASGENPFHEYWYQLDPETGVRHAAFEAAPHDRGYHRIPGITDIDGGELFAKGFFRYLPGGLCLKISEGVYECSTMSLRKE